jgi:hypothetical protein
LGKADRARKTLWPEEGAFRGPDSEGGGSIREELEQPKIPAYKDGVLETVREPILRASQDGQVRARLSDALTKKALSGRKANREIGAVSGSGDTIEITFR